MRWAEDTRNVAVLEGGRVAVLSHDRNGPGRARSELPLGQHHGTARVRVEPTPSSSMWIGLAGSGYPVMALVRSYVPSVGSPRNWTSALSGTEWWSVAPVIVPSDEPTDFDVTIDEAAMTITIAVNGRVLAAVQSKFLAQETTLLGGQCRPIIL
jgi:hypothetical protein